MKFKLLLIVLLTFCAGNISAQTYESGILPYQQIITEDSVFTFSFVGIPGNAWGQGKLVVYYNGDFADFGEVVNTSDEDANIFGAAGPYTTNNDCGGLDSTVLYFDATLIDAWLLDNQVDFFLHPSLEVGAYCMDGALSCRISYNYCVAGYPVEFATITNTANSFCPTDGSVMLTGTPTNGTWSGNGVTGSNFNPSMLSPGSSSVITYTATDAIGCITFTKDTLYVRSIPTVVNTFACPGGSVDLTSSGPGQFVWYEDAGLTQLIDTGEVVTVPLINETTTYYVSAIETMNAFTIDSIGFTGSVVVDHDNTSGDDRGGIAITPDYLYVVGDDYTTRFNASDLSGQVSLPIRDGIFSDLSSGKVYTLWNTTVSNTPSDNDATISINAIHELDENLDFTGIIHSLSMEIPSEYYSMLFAGHGKLGFYSAFDQHVYIIDLLNYSVTDNGMIMNLNNEGSENWSDWGVLEYDGTDYYGVYANYNGQISRHNFTTDAVVDMTSFPSDISDMASMTISPWNNRWYFHHEYSSGMFGGNNETAGYANASATAALLGYGAIDGCYSEMTVEVNVIDMGGDTTDCEYNVPIMLFAGNGYQSYTWNGVNNNYNVFAAMEAGDYIVEAIDEHNCTIVDTITVTLDPCLGVQEAELFSSVEVFPNPTMSNAHLKIETATNVTGTLMIVNALGSVMQVKDYSLVAGTNTLELQTNDFATGIYFVRLSDDKGKTSVVRLVKN